MKQALHSVLVFVFRLKLLLQTQLKNLKFPDFALGAKHAAAVTVVKLSEVRLPKFRTPVEKTLALVFGLVLLAFLAGSFGTVHVKGVTGWVLHRMQYDITRFVERYIVHSATKIQNEATDRLIAEKEHELDIGKELDTSRWNKVASEIPEVPVEAPAPVETPAVEYRPEPTVHVGPVSEGPIEDSIPTAKSKVKHEGIVKRIKARFSRKPSYARELNRAQHDAGKLLRSSTRP
jgi:hypothetical protein